MKVGDRIKIVDKDDGEFYAMGIFVRYKDCKGGYRAIGYTNEQGNYEQVKTEEFKASKFKGVQE